GPLAQQGGGQDRQRGVLGPADADLAGETPAARDDHAVHQAAFLATSARSMSAASFRHSSERNAPVCCARRTTESAWPSPSSSIRCPPSFSNSGAPFRSRR